MKIMVTGGAGFIGSALIRQIIAHSNHEIINIDKLTYAGNLDSLAEVINSPKFTNKIIDICDKELIDDVFKEHKPTCVMHLAAESHVDRSIDGPSDS